MGISKHATLEEATRNHRRIRHRAPLLNQVEEEIEKCRVNSVQEEDVALWKLKDDVFKKKFSSKATWNQIREVGMICSRSRGV